MAERRGFTLAETVVALLVFSVTLSLLGLVASSLMHHYQGKQNQQRDAQVARAIMSLEVPEMTLHIKTCFKRELILTSKTTNKQYYLSVKRRAFGLYTGDGGNMKYLSQVKQVTYVQLSKQRVQATIEFEEGTSVTQEITFYEGP